jgi:DNA excision repair protein ERCC-3
MPKSVTPPGVEQPRGAAGQTYDPTNPLIVQGDRSVLVEVENPRYTEARDALAPFAELEKSPEHIHTYRLSTG